MTGYHVRKQATELAELPGRNDRAECGMVNLPRPGTCAILKAGYPADVLLELLGVLADVVPQPGKPGPAGTPELLGKPRRQAGDGRKVVFKRLNPAALRGSGKRPVRNAH